MQFAMSTLIAFVNTFLCGAIFMAVILCLKPEITAFVRKVYYWPEFGYDRSAPTELLDAYRAQIHQMMDRMRRVLAVANDFSNNQYDLQCAVDDLENAYKEHADHDANITDLINIQHEYMLDFKRHIENLDMLTKQFEE